MGHRVKYNTLYYGIPSINLRFNPNVDVPLASHFEFLPYKNKSDAMRYRCNIICVHCNSHNEDDWHVLFDCSFAQQVWITYPWVTNRDGLLLLVFKFLLIQSLGILRTRRLQFLSRAAGWFGIHLTSSNTKDLALVESLSLQVLSLVEEYTNH